MKVYAEIVNKLLDAFKELYDAISRAIIKRRGKNINRAVDIVKDKTAEDKKKLKALNEIEK